MQDHCHAQSPRTVRGPTCRPGVPYGQLNRAAALIGDMAEGARSKRDRVGVPAQHRDRQTERHGVTLAASLHSSGPCSPIHPPSDPAINSMEIHGHPSVVRQAIHGHHAIVAGQHRQ